MIIYWSPLFWAHITQNINIYIFIFFSFFLLLWKILKLTSCTRIINKTKTKRADLSSSYPPLCRPNNLFSSCIVCVRIYHMYKLPKNAFCSLDHKYCNYFITVCKRQQHLLPDFLFFITLKVHIYILNIS